MLYIIVQGECKGKVTLVKCDDREHLERRLKLEDDESIVGTLTSNEVSVLDTASFAVISG